MKPQELRIGNYVIDNKTGSICTVDGIHYPNEDVVTEDKKYDDWFRTITPATIPLTEEWLIKLGFRKLGIEWIHTNGFILEECYNGLCYSAGEGVALGVPIKYVHQLQNLYFALTGEELTIKE